MPRRRRIRWPVLVAALLLGGGAVALLLNPELLAPFATRLINRHLTASVDGTLRVGAYDVRPFAGVDLRDVTLTLPGERGGLTLVAVDTLELDFRLREVIGRTVRLRRLAARGVEIYHNQDPPAPAAADADEGWIAATAPRLVVDAASVSGARIEVSGHDGQLAERISGLSWRGSLQAADAEARVVTRSATLDWETRSARFDQVYGAVSVARDTLRIEDVSALWNDGRVQVAGRYANDDLALRAAGEGLSVFEVNELVRLDLDFAAQGTIECEIAARADTVWFGGRFTGRFEDWELEDLELAGTVTGDVAEFPRVRGGVGGARFDGRLQVDGRVPAGEVIVIEGEGEGLNIKEGLIPDQDPADLPLTAGRGRLRIVHTAADEVTTVEAELRDGRIEIMPFDSSRVHVRATPDSLQLRHVELWRGSLHAVLSGGADAAEVFGGDLAVEVGDLRDLPAEWEWPALTGAASGQVTVSGPVDRLGVAGSVQLRRFALGPMTAEATEASLVGERVLGEDWQVSAALGGGGFTAGGVPLGDYLLWLRGDATSVAVDSFRTVRGDTVTTLHGRADFTGDRAALQIDRARLEFVGATWRTAAPVAATLAPGLVQLPRLRLVSDRGSLEAVVDYARAADRLDGHVDVEDFDLNLLDPLLRQRLRTGGRATAAIDLGGSASDPRVGIRGGLRDATFPLARVDSLAVDAELRGGVVTIDTLDVGSEWGRATATGTIASDADQLADFWSRARLDLDLGVRGGDWAFLEQFAIEGLEGLAGRVEGDLHLSGTTSEPLVTGRLDSAPFHFHWLHLDRLEGRVRADAGQLALGELRGNQDQLRLEGRLEIPLRFDLLSQPVSPPDGPFYARLAIPEGSDLAPLLHATDAFTRVEGRGQGELLISGPLNRPRYQGSVRLTDVGFVLRGNEEIYRDCEAVGVFRDDLLIIQEIRGREGLRGTFAGAGTVTFSGLELATWDITFRADRFLVASIPDLRALIRTDNGRLTGVPVGPDSTLVPRFSGDYTLIRGRYTGNFSDPGTGAPDPTLGTVAPDWLADLRITGPPRAARIVNNTMDLYLSGDVNLIRDENGLTFRGGMDIDTGRLPVFHNTFVVRDGRLDFSQAVGVVPWVDIDAETRVRLQNPASSTSVVERITVHATGPASAMQISYSSESGYPREAIERMLLGLSPYPDEQGDQGALATASIGAGLNILESEIAREIDLFDTVEIDQIRRREAGNTGLEPLIGVGKYVGTDLYIKYAQGLNQNDRDILIEYQITNHLLLQTEIRRRIDEYQGDATYNLDLKYRFEY